MDWVKTFFAWCARSISTEPKISVGVTLPTFYAKEDRMLLSVTRTNKTKDGIFGTLAIDTSPFKCVTLENLSLSIPAGSYPVRWMWSQHFLQIMPEIVVTGREAIELHWANYPSQLEGCIALGTEAELSANCINESKIAWVKFIREILNQPNLTLKIIEDYGGAQNA